MSRRDGVQGYGVGKNEGTLAQNWNGQKLGFPTSGLEAWVMHWRAWNGWCQGLAVTGTFILVWKYKHLGNCRLIGNVRLTRTGEDPHLDGL